MPSISSRASARVLRIKPSPSGAARARVVELMRQGRQILDLTIGEPDFDTPGHIKHAACEAIARGDTKYTGSQGTPELRRAICSKLQRENGLSFEPEQIFVGAGAKQVLHNAFAATLNPGDEVIIPAPYWVSYPDMVLLNDATPIIVPTDAANSYKLTAAQLAAAITPRSRWVVLNSPNNPTGVAYTRTELRAIAEVILNHDDLWLITDDIYEHFYYDDMPYISPVQAAPELAERALIVNGVSKTYAMTGWRVGYGAAPKTLIDSMATLQSQTTSCISSISQAAAVAALNGPQELVATRVAEFKLRRDRALSILEAVPLLDCIAPSGAFYIFPSCTRAIGKTTRAGHCIETDLDFVMYLLEEVDVAVLDGAAYGLSPSFRLSFATGMDTVTTACERIKQACAALS